MFISLKNIFYISFLFDFCRLRRGGSGNGVTVAEEIRLLPPLNKKLSSPVIPRLLAAIGVPISESPLIIKACEV